MDMQVSPGTRHLFEDRICKMILCRVWKQMDVQWHGASWVAYSTCHTIAASILVRTSPIDRINSVWRGSSCIVHILNSVGVEGTESSSVETFRNSVINKCIL